jgi:hypothetical protein
LPRIAAGKRLWRSATTLDLSFPRPATYVDTCTLYERSGVANCREVHRRAGVAIVNEHIRTVAFIRDWVGDARPGG